MDTLINSSRMLRTQCDERREREQYFFDAHSRNVLADVLKSYSRPCCLCAPTVGEELHARGRAVRVLDIDGRFASLDGFRNFDLRRPQCMNESYDIILCDPPFFTVPLAVLLLAIVRLHQIDRTKPVLFTYLARRATVVERVFQGFGIVRSPWRVEYLTATACARNDIVLFSNCELPDLPLSRMPVPAAPVRRAETSR